MKPFVRAQSDKDPISYRIGEPMRFTFASAGGDRIRWTITGDDGSEEHGEAPCAPAVQTAGPCAPAVQTAGLPRPGFVRLVAELLDSNGDVLASFNGGAGAAVADIRQDRPEPADFDAFWKRRKAALAAVPLAGATTREIPSGRDGVRLYEVTIPCAGGRPSTGYLSVPVAGGPFPARAHFHGYNESWSESAYQPPAPESLPLDALFLDVSAHGFELNREADYYLALRAASGSNGHDYAFDPIQNANPDTAYFGGMVWRVLRALDYLKGRPEWDGRTLVVEGGSQGGLQSIWAAALDHDVTECRIFIPWCCNIGGPEAGRAHGDWHVPWVPALGYYDAANMARRFPATCRANIVWAGLGDYICPPSGVMAFYNNLACPKNITFVQGAMHTFHPTKPWQTSSLRAPALPGAGYSFRYGDRVVRGSGSLQVDEHLRVTVDSVAYPEFSAREWVLWFENPSQERSAVLSDIRDGDFLVPLPPAPKKFKGDISLPGDRAVVSMNGCVPGIDYSTDNASSATEFAAAAHYFHPMRGTKGNVFTFANNSARSSDNQAPFFEVTQGGEGAIVAIGWTGGWRARFADTPDGVRVEAGMAHARFYLEPGEKLRTTRILVMNASTGEDAPNKFRRLVRKHFSHVASRPGVREGLLAYELWGGISSDEMVRRVKALKAKGLAYEDLWIDAGWYGDSQKCDDAYTGDWSAWTGDWTPNRRVHPDGLADVAAAAKDAGMGMMLWLEPERVVPSSRFAQEHADLLSGALLYYGNEEGRIHVRETISDLASRLGFSCYRQDFNYDPGADLAKLDGPDREGVAEIRHITGLYRLWDELLERFPKMLIDNCASGGRRIDIETLRRSVAFFRSDYQCGFNLNPDVLQAHNAGISRLLPYTGCTVKRSDVYSLRSAYSASHGVAYWNTVFQKEEDVDWAAAKKCCDEYRRIRRFFPCDFHNLGSATMDPTAWAIWQYHDPETGEGVVMAFRRAESPSDTAVVALKGLPADATVETENLDTGAKAAVPARAVEIALPGRRSSTILLYRLVPKATGDLS